ncbi:hypothetical protein [Terrihabitans soli]|nr:hypothetical protein [Terrihabitans soli]
MIRTMMKGLSLAAMLLAAGGGQAGAVDFSGKHVDVIIPYTEGGGSTFYIRLLAPLLQKELPGNPPIIIRHIPGGGSVKGINQFQQDAKPDGQMVGQIGVGTFLNYILQDPAVAYDLPKFQAFLTSPFGAVVYGRKDIGLTGDAAADVKHLTTMTPIYGGDGPTASDLPILLSLDLLGVKMKTIFGMGNSESRGAFERGEFNIKFDNMASWSNAIVPMIKEGTVVPLFTLGFQDASGKIVRDPLAPEVPTFLEVYEKVKGKKLEGLEYDIWKTLFNIRVMGSKMLVLPAGTSPEIVKAFADATARVMKAPELQTPEAKGVLGDYPQSTGDAAAAVLKGASVMTDDERKWLKSWLSEKYGVK